MNPRGYPVGLGDKALSQADCVSYNMDELPSTVPMEARWPPLPSWAGLCPESGTKPYAAFLSFKTPGTK